MTLVLRAREEITFAVRAAKSANREQAKRIYDPSREIDSALEHVLAAARLVVDSDARRHLAAAAEQLKHIHRLNHVEGSHEEAVLEQVANRWTNKSLAAALGAPLSVLGNPIIQGDRRDEALAEARRIIAVAPRGLLVDGDRVNPTLAHELRGKKSTALWALLCEPRAAVVAC